MTRAMRFDVEAGRTATGVRFRPGILPVLLRIDGGELTDLDCEAPRGLETPEVIDPAQKAVAAIAASSMSIADAVGQANLSERQFRRTCLRLTGLTPKRLSRIARFRGMLSMAPAMLRREETWAAVAAECGYYDQSHLIHDFSAFSGGITPDRFSNPPPPQSRKLALTAMKITPILFLDAIEPALPFWMDRLGFTNTGEVADGDRIGFAMFALGDTEVMLQTHESAKKDNAAFVADYRACLFVQFDSFDEVLKRLDGWPVEMPVRDTFYGLREIGVLAPGGHLLVFAAPIPAATV